MNRTTRIIYAILSGILLCLPWTQWMNGLILMIAFVPLLLVEDYLYHNKKTNRTIQAFSYSLLTFFIWNSVTTWWLAIPSPTGMAITVILNSLAMATVFWAFHYSKRLLGMKTGNFMFIIFWIAFEYLHLKWELSWSWLNLGNGLAKNIQLIQWYEFTGSLGGSLWALAANMVFAVGLIKIRKFNILKAGLFHVVVFSLLIIIPVGISYYLFSSYQEKGESLQTVIIQPNIDPYTEKYDAMSGNEQLDRILDQAASLATEDIDYFVAPETALPESNWENELLESQSVLRIIDFLQDYPNAEFIIGAVTGQLYFPSEEIPVTAEKYGETNIYFDEFNSALQISADSTIQIYHKSQLVLGVEKMPFPGTFGFLENLSLELGGSNGSLGSQAGREVFASENNTCKVAPVICYESVFGDYVNGYIRLGANAIFVITNDGWFKNTAGIVQHLRFSQIRAIETRRSVVRSANTGISCFINPKGELVQPTKYGEETVISGSITTNDKLTFYTQSGDFIGRILAFLAVLGLFYTLVARLKQGKKVD